MDTWKWIIEKHQTILESGDSRTNQWPLVRSPLPVVCFILIYVTISVMGPLIMKFKSTPPIRPVMLAFNIYIVITSCYLCKEFLVSAYLANYSIICQPLDVTDDPLAVRMASAFWLFYIMRFTIAVDTVFLILRKSHQIPLRHAFHHAATPMASWVAVKYIPGGQSFLHGFLNSIVHIVVYSYVAAICYPSTKKYATAVKKYIRTIHVTQLSIIVSHSLLGAYKGCFTPKWPLYGVAGFCSTLIVHHLVLGETVLILDLMDAYWPKWLYGYRSITEIKKHMARTSDGHFRDSNWNFSITKTLNKL